MADQSLILHVGEWGGDDIKIRESAWLRQKKKKAGVGMRATEGEKGRRG